MPGGDAVAAAGAPAAGTATFAGRLPAIPPAAAGAAFAVGDAPTPGDLGAPGDFCGEAGTGLAGAPFFGGEVSRCEAGFPPPGFPAAAGAGGAVAAPGFPAAVAIGFVPPSMRSVLLGGEPGLAAAAAFASKRSFAAARPSERDAACAAGGAAALPPAGALPAGEGAATGDFAAAAATIGARSGRRQSGPKSLSCDKNVTRPCSMHAARHVWGQLSTAIAQNARSRSGSRECGSMSIGLPNATSRSSKRSSSLKSAFGPTTRRSIRSNCGTSLGA